MKKKTRDFLTISMAMLTVLLCGYGLGHLVGEKKGLQIHATQDPATDLTSNWSAQTIIHLETKLNLTPEQLSYVQEQIRPYSATLEKDLRQLRSARTRKLLDFYEILEPRLDDWQKTELKKLQNRLRENR